MKTGSNSLRHLLREILNNKGGSREKWEKAISESGWRNSDRYLLIQFRPNPRYDKNAYADYLTVEIERKWQGCIGFEYEKRLMVLVNKEQFSSSEDDMPFRQALAYFLRESLLVAGISRTIETVKDIYPAYKQAEAAIEIGVSEAPTNWSFNFEGYALSYLLKNGKGEFEPEYVCSEKLLSLRRCDGSKNTEYYKTLNTYFSCRLNASAAAKKLCLHRSSFLNRMERIQKLANIDFNSADELLHLAISFKIMGKASS
jgi:sugar diacid utilization regulator